MMSRKRYSDGDALKTLREIDVDLNDGFAVVSSCRKAGISDWTHYYWRKKFWWNGAWCFVNGDGEGWDQKCPRNAFKKAQMVVKDEATLVIVACRSWKEI